MSKLIYFTGASLDGFIAGENDSLDWSVPDEEVLAFISDLHRPIGTYLYGRKNYETMTVWHTPEVIPNPTAATLDFGQIWQAADKIVYSKSLEAVSTPKTRLEREFDPLAVRLYSRPNFLEVRRPKPSVSTIRWRFRPFQSFSRFAIAKVYPAMSNPVLIQ